MPDSNPFRTRLKPCFLNSLVQRLLGLTKLINFYDQRPQGLSPFDFLSYTLNCFGARADYVAGQFCLADLPKTGPLMVVANHPLGGLEGVALARDLLKHRPDLKVLTNELLTRIPELAPVFVGVDVLSGRGQAANKKGLLEITRHLKNDGALLVFPAGKVANYRLSRGSVYDHEWNRLVGMLVKKTSPEVLPVYVDAHNSWLFYLAAGLHPTLRALMLPRELSNKSNFRLSVHVGPLIKSNEIKHLDDPRAITDYLRLATEFACQEKTRKHYAGLTFSPLAVVDSGSNETVLPSSRFLLKEDGDYAVYCAPYEELGLFMKTIGKARELTFRAVGEGTGNSIDTDRFDPYYTHLFVWDKAHKQIAGGYRIGRVDEIVSERGIDALYSRTLYKFSEGYLKKLGNALEMGRSFVHPDYQRQSKVLDLLWKGIGLYVVKNPNYHTLFGAVSISNEHSDMARALIAESMLESFRAEQRYLEDVRPVAPLKVSGKVWSRDMLASLSHVSLINKLIGRCDPGKALPTLLRHYLSLNGRFVCFSVNKVFNDSLDGLIIVDLRETPKKYLNRYMGKEGVANAQSVWQRQSQVEVA